MPAPENNVNAMKGDEPASSFLHIRARPRDKAAWVKAAQQQRRKLAEWATDSLNSAAGRAAGVGVGPKPPAAHKRANDDSTTTR